MSIDEEPPFPTTFTLNNGVEMPAIGFGTYRLRHEEILMKTVDLALEAGYRFFDTASVYSNEIHFKRVFKELLPKHGLVREDIFITSKISPGDHGTPEHVAEVYQRTLDNIGIDHLDMYLIHFPGSAKVSAEDLRNPRLRDATWAGMTKLYDAGLVGSIGVSNFTTRHLKELLNNNHGVIPTVNQVEFHPYYRDVELLNYCKVNDIVLQAYCSLGGSSASNKDLLNDPAVIKIASNHKVTCAQVLLAWALQQDVAIIPKSTDLEHMKQNNNLHFRLAKEEMQLLFDLGERKIKYAWDPKSVA